MIGEFLFNVLVFPGVLFSCAMAFWLQWLERKIVARVQKRIGPKFTGPSGLLQPIYDFLKLLSKEEILPEHVDKLYFRLAPVLAVTVPVFGMLFIPITGVKTMFNFEGDFLLILLLFSFSVFATATAGYAVFSPYTSVGVGRHIVQYSIYESFMALSLVLAAFQASTLSIYGLLEYQMLKGPLVLYQPLGFVVAVLALIAKLEKPPFDLPHAKQEIAAGWLTEYSGRGLAFLKLYKDLSMVYGISILAVTYFAGPLGPMFSANPTVMGLIYFGLKTLFIALIIILIRSIAARVRVYGLAEHFWIKAAPLVLFQMIIAFAARWL